ncbi:MAG: hypothetical protein WBM71_03960 [Sedimenticolaceae bacterium]
MNQMPGGPLADLVHPCAKGLGKFVVQHRRCGKFFALALALLQFGRQLPRLVADTCDAFLETKKIKRCRGSILLD